MSLGQSEKSFDAELIISQMGDFRANEPNTSRRQVHFYTPKGVKLETSEAWPHVVGQLANLVEIVKFEDDPRFADEIEALEAQVDHTEELLERKYGTDLVELIREGRIRVTQLINSRGGEVAASQAIQLAIDDIVAREGEVESFDFIQVGSAALDLGIRGKIYCTDDTFFMHHLPVAKADANGEFKARKSDWLYYSRVIETLLAKANPEGRKYIKDRAAKARPDEQYTMVFSGKQLAGCGVVTRSFTDVRSMAKRFSTTHGTEQRSDFSPFLRLQVDVDRYLKRNGLKTYEFVPEIHANQARELAAQSNAE